MSLTVLRTMLLGIVRDRGALALTFLLPVAFFLVFAAIFAGSSGDAARLDVAIADLGQTEETGRLVRALAREKALQAIGANGEKPAPPAVPRLTADEVRALVKSGRADVGLIVRAEASDAGALFGGGPGEHPPLTVVEDSAKAIAARIVVGLVQKAYTTALPDVAARGGIDLFVERFGALTPEQQKKWDRGYAGLRKDAQEGDREGDTDNDAEDTIEIEQVTGRSAGQNQIAYYAGAVAVMFLMFAAAHGAVMLLEEKDAGIVDRVLAGPGGMRPLLLGKFLFLVLSGFVQVTVIFLVAWRLRGVDLPGHVLGYTLVTLATSIAAAGLALALTSVCRNRRQANSVASIGILILSAVGGSMVPRFFMPPFIRTLGWFTPNTWALEAYTKLFWRDEPLSALALPVAVLAGAGLLSLAFARLMMRRWESV